MFSRCTLSLNPKVLISISYADTNKSLWLRNIQLGCYGAMLGILVVFVNDKEAVERYGFFYGYDWLVWMCILLQSAGGLLVALVIQHADNVCKLFATSFSILLTISLVVLFYDEPFGLLSVFGGVIVIIASVLFSDLTKSNEIGQLICNRLCLYITHILRFINVKKSNDLHLSNGLSLL